MRWQSIGFADEFLRQPYLKNKAYWELLLVWSNVERARSCGICEGVDGKTQKPADINTKNQIFDETGHIECFWSALLYQLSIFDNPMTSDPKMKDKEFPPHQPFPPIILFNHFHWTTCVFRCPFKEQVLFPTLDLGILATPSWLYQLPLGKPTFGTPPRALRPIVWYWLGHQSCSQRSTR